MPFSGEGDEGSSMFQTKTPHFFKIILDHSLRDGKLAIPRKFVRNHANNLSNQALLKVSSGAVWKVELVKSDGEMWFQNGWRQFADFYSVACGHFLVFEYQGSCEFHVLMFDTSAVEIEYPFSRNGKNESNCTKRFQEPRDGETKDEISIEILEVACPRPNKMMKTNSNGKAESNLKLQSLVPPIGNQSGRIKMKNPMKDVKRASPTRQLKGKFVECKRTEGVGHDDEAASKFSSYTPFKKLPSVFFGTDILPRRQTVMLQVAGRSWPVRLLSYGSPIGNYLSSGWGSVCKGKFLASWRCLHL